MPGVCRRGGVAAHRRMGRSARAVHGQYQNNRCVEIRFSRSGAFGGRYSRRKRCGHMLNGVAAPKLMVGKPGAFDGHSNQSSKSQPANGFAEIGDRCRGIRLTEEIVTLRFQRSFRVDRLCHLVG